MRYRYLVLIAAAVFPATGCHTPPHLEARHGESCPMSTRKPLDPTVVRSDEDWRAVLTPEQYRIAREKGTEPPFTGKYWNTKTPGTYVCAACGAPLFASSTKYDSGSGWPSFWQPIEKDAIAYDTDDSLFMTRTEILCARCGAHLGHVFDDGPEPTGLRYCVNSAVLHLEPETPAGDEHPPSSPGDSAKDPGTSTGRNGDAFKKD